MDDNTGDDMVIDLDLNREPFVDPSPPSPPSPVLGSFLDELDTSRGGIEGRIRQLEAVTARAGQRQRWRRIMNNPELNYNSVIEPTVGVRNENQGDNGVVERPIEERVGGERVRNCKRDITHVAKALEMELDAKKTENGGADDDGVNGNFYDCNICLDMARDPVLTCCGHMFCWGCFYQVPFVDSISKECPVCKGEVIDSNITPIYGNGKNSQALELESGVKIPPRPPARRVESVRQQSFGRAISQIPVADARRRIRIGLGLTEENRHLQVVNSSGPISEVNPSVLHSSDDAASLSITSALNSERFVEDLETYIINRRSMTPYPANQERDTLVANTTVTAEMDPSVSLSLSSRRPLATTVLHVGPLAADGSVEIDLTISRPASSRRRRGLPRALNFEGESSLELRRRRLR